MLPMALWDEELPSLVLLLIYPLFSLLQKGCSGAFWAQMLHAFTPGPDDSYCYRIFPGALTLATSEEVTSPPSHSILGEEIMCPEGMVGAALGPNPHLPTQGYSFLFSNVHALTSFPLFTFVPPCMPQVSSYPGLKLGGQSDWSTEKSIPRCLTWLDLYQRPRHMRKDANRTKSNANLLILDVWIHS